MVQVGLRILDIFSDKLPVRNPSIRGSVRALTDGQCDVTVMSPRDLFLGGGQAQHLDRFENYLSTVLSYHLPALPTRWSPTVLG